MSALPQGGWTPTPHTILYRVYRDIPDDSTRDAQVQRALSDYRVKPNRTCPQCGCDSECVFIENDPDPAVTYAHVWCTRTKTGPRVKWGNIKDGFVYYYQCDRETAETTAGTSSAARPPKVYKLYPVADADTIDRALRAIFRLLTLTEKNKANLARRGLDPDKCGPEGPYFFASIVPKQKPHLASELVAHGIFRRRTDALGIYGFSGDARWSDGHIVFLPNLKDKFEGAALLEAVVDETGRWVGFQYSPNNPKLDKKGKPQKRLTPVRFSTRGIYHVAPRPSVEIRREVWHTEAIIKADLTSDRLGVIAIGSLGAGNHTSQVAAAQAVDPDQSYLHVVALDADQWPEYNKQAGRNEQTIAHALLDAGYRVALARWDPAMGKGPDDAVVVGAVITVVQYVDNRPKPRSLIKINNHYAWQDRTETEAERVAYLHSLVANAAQDAATSLDQRPKGIMKLLNAAPGMGKTYALAALGAITSDHPNGQRDLAYIVPRRDMVGEDKDHPLSTYRVAEACTKDNCSTPELHDALVRKGYNAIASLHRHQQCGYALQWQGPGSRVYTPPYIQSSYPSEHHGGIILDDTCDPISLLPETKYDIPTLKAATGRFKPDSAPDVLLRNIQAAIADIQQQGQAANGWAVFEAINRHCNGQQLAALLGEMNGKAYATDPHPTTKMDIHASNARERAEKLPPIVVPQIVRALLAELPSWQRRGAWNSRIWIRPVSRGHKGSDAEYALFITTAKQFGVSKGGKLPPVLMADATGCPEILGLIYECAIEHISMPPVDPPPDNRHLAIRTGEYFGKRALCTVRQDESHPDLDRAIAKARYVLNDLDPIGEKRRTGKVGLITYKSIMRQVGRELGIPVTKREQEGDNQAEDKTSRVGNFWGVRGSNRLENCEILLVLGTPTLAPDELLRIARAIYWKDPDPILDEEPTSEGDTGLRYRDKRLQLVSDAITRAELTQCAFRNRPLTYHHRTVVTFCAAEIDYLPITEEIRAFPTLTIDGCPRTDIRQAERDEKLRVAAETLLERGESVTIRSLSKEAHVGHEAASEWLRAGHERSDAANAEMIPETLYSNLYSKTGIIATIQPSRQAPPAPGAFPPASEDTQDPSDADDPPADSSDPIVPYLSPRERLLALARAQDYPETRIEGGGRWAMCAKGERSWERFCQKADFDDILAAEKALTLSQAG
jgi:hypothetical protein